MRTLGSTSSVRAPLVGQDLPCGLDLVFCRPGGIPEDPNVIGRRFGRRIRDLAKLPAIGLHGLRHTHATLLLEEGVDVKTVSERLGHDSVQTTLELYGHVTPKMRGNAAARFGSLLNTARVAPIAALMTADKLELTTYVERS